MQCLRPEAFFDLDSFRHRDLFRNADYVWEALPSISAFLQARCGGNVDGVSCFRRPLPDTVVLWRGRAWTDGFEIMEGDVTKGNFRVRIEGEETADAVVLYAGSVLWDERIHLGHGTVVEPGALIKGPTIIGSFTEVRQGAYIRGKCIVGDRCVVGHTTEIKGSVMLNGAKAGHFAYIGDSILGHSSNLGAGTKLANLKIIPGSIRIRVRGEVIDTGLRKFGAVLGDGVEIGCNTVTNPGTVLGKGCAVHPVASVPAGYHAPKTVLR
jgi:UDP-N-acetylglucosamine diphosphorylase / glucose-1-phosphate thymidylyltransferase / UDP-N-acetylgalactosamine diphosphorylase / glucosamine-1-phosphate N-acetyltransferase / galactosamine-1-phosphate N-acetyltransferase